MNRKLLLALDKTLFRASFYVLALLASLRRDKAELPLTLDTANPRLLVIRPGGLGDGLMAIPFLRLVKDVYPESHVTLVCVRKNQNVFVDLPWFDELLVLDELPKLFGNMARLRRTRFDALFDLEPFRRTSAIVGWLIPARARIGFDTNSRRHLYTHLVSYSGDNRFEAANMLHQLRVLGMDPPYDQAADMSFSLARSALADARDLLHASGVDEQRDYLVAVAVGVLKPHHRWVMSEFAELIRLIKANDEGSRIVLVGSSNDVDDTDRVLRELDYPGDVVNLVGKTNIPVALGVLKCCRVLIACDGGMVYMAAAMGCSTVSLWGPGVMERFKPPGDNHVGVRKSYACIPCVTWDRLGEFPPCPYNRRCYNDLEASEVFSAYIRLKQNLGAGTALDREILDYDDDAHALRP